MTTGALSTAGVAALLIMSLTGVSAWWAKNILRDEAKVRVFAAIGTIAAVILVWSTW